jgi:hemolysin activation/secretion protein
LLVQANASAQTTLPLGISAAASVTAQMTDATLPQAQQWILGGFGNLSAWLPAVLIGDSGALARVVVSSPPFSWSVFTITGGAYAEAGISRLEQRGPAEPYTRGLGDVGLTLSGSTTTGTSLTLTYGFPAWYRNVDGAVRESVDRNRANLYFTLNQTF